MRFTFLSALGTFALAAMVVAGVATAGTGHFVNNASTPLLCTIGGNNTKTATIDCSGKVAGYGANEPVFVYVVIRADAGCSNTGNLDIPGQRNFSSTQLSPDSSGSILFDVNGTVSCHGQQNAFISSTVTLELYNCTSGNSPTFSKKTGLQTNTACTLEDSATVTASYL